MINQERIKNLLLELVQIDSVSREEREVAQRIRTLCEQMGAQVEIDDAGSKVGGNTGNVIARFPGTLPQAEAIMMSAHMDTVVPGRGVKPIVEGDIIHRRLDRPRRRRQVGLRRRHRDHTLPSGTVNTARAD